MKVAMLYDSSDLDARTVYERLAAGIRNGTTIRETVDTAEEELEACIGCFGCWIRTPGICIHTKDGGTAFLRQIFDADYLLIITRILWGGYSARIKSYADRMLPLLHPYFRKHNREMHHRLRYGRMPAILAAGFGANTPEEEHTFASYTEAHRDNTSAGVNRGTFILKERCGTGEPAPLSGYEIGTLDDCVKWLAEEAHV